MFIGHSSPEGREQPLLKHLTKVAEMSQEYASHFNAGKLGYYCGLLHDLGKYSDKAQERICRNGEKVDHSTAGAQKANELGLLPIAYCIAGHHGGLPNGGSQTNHPQDPTLFARLKRKNIEDYSQYKKELDIPIPNNMVLPIEPIEKNGFSIAFLIRMLYSCLVDADFLDTECFMSDGKVIRPTGDNVKKLYKKYTEYIKRFENPKSDINKFRTKILHNCLDVASGPKGLYTLSVPTGGGKTISSLGFALKHAMEHDMRRVIYVIPYTSIIEQNAEIFESVLGKANVLRHYSGYNFDDDDTESAKIQLATENWDMPIIVTTNVQFFESLYSNKPSKCRKIHNISRSVLIFDEAQLIPYPYLLPCVRSIAELVHNYGCTAVLCSATQPELEKLFPKKIAANEICTDYQNIYMHFERVRYKFIGTVDIDNLVEKMRSHNNVLCVVNTRKQAQKLYENLKLRVSDGVFHLSTLMYPEHRREVLEMIRFRLKNKLQCHVVSTSLIEAGVDVDFDVVYREEAGLDSIIQAGGRCNREGEKRVDESYVYIFCFDKEHSSSWPPSLRQPVEVMRAVTHNKDNVAAPETIKEYFNLMHTVKGNDLDKYNIVKAFEDGTKNRLSFQFADVAENFKIIEDNTVPVLITICMTALDIADEINSEIKVKGWCGRDLLRRAGNYSVNVYEHELISLYRTGVVDRLFDGFYVLLNNDAYSYETGLSIIKDEGIGIFV